MTNTTHVGDQLRLDLLREALVPADKIRDIVRESVDDTLSIPTQNPTNILAFSTQVDGRPVAAEVDRRARLA